MSSVIESGRPRPSNTDDRNTQVVPVKKPQSPAALERWLSTSLPRWFSAESQN